MGWLQKLQNKAINKVFYWANSVNGTPSFSQFGNNIMNDETVFTITNRILDEYSKMNPRHKENKLMLLIITSMRF